MVQRNRAEIDFGINYSPFNIPASVLQRVKVTQNAVSTYPSPHSENNLTLLSKYLALRKDNVLLLNGSSEGFFILPQACKFKKSTVITPTFWEYAHTLSLHNVQINYLNLLPSFSLNLADLEENLRKSDSVYICNPNNPTSSHIKKDILAFLISKFKNKIFVVDETYLLFSKNYRKETLNQLAAHINNLFVVTSLSKFFSIGGVRLGFCVSSRENIDLIRKFKNPYSTNIFAEQLLPLLFKSSGYIKKTREFLDAEKDRVYGMVARLPWLTPFKPSANFVLVKIEDPKVELKSLLTYLEKRGVRVRSGTEFKGLSNRYFRFCVRTRKENDSLIKSLKDFYTISSSRNS